MIETFEAKPCDDMIELSQIERMSVTERLRAMDQLWDSLSRHGDEIPPRTGIKTFWLTGKRERSAET